MTEFELGSLISEASLYSSGIFEFWLTLSFAAVVAATFAVEKLHRNYMRLLIVGYLLASIFFLLTRIYIASQILDLMQQLDAAGYDSSRFDSTLGLVVAAYAPILHILGTIGVVIYMFKANRASNG